MEKLLTAIKTKINATGNLSALASNKTFLLEAPKPKVATDLPYAVVIPFPSQSRFGFQDSAGLDTVQIQYSVFHTSQHAAEDLVNKLHTAFHGQPLTLSDGRVVKGRRVQRGVVRVPERLPNDQRVFHSFGVYEWHVNDL